VNTEDSKQIKPSIMRGGERKEYMIIIFHSLGRLVKQTAREYRYF